MRRIAVVGSRGYKKLAEVKQFIFEQKRDTVIVSGGANGVDAVAVTEARRLKMPYEIYLPDWNLHGKSAGVIRNREIVNNADEVIAFWDGKSSGTKNTIDTALALGKPVKVLK